MSKMGRITVSDKKIYNAYMEASKAMEITPMKAVFNEKNKKIYLFLQFEGLLDVEDFLKYSKDFEFQTVYRFAEMDKWMDLSEQEFENCVNCLEDDQDAVETSGKFKGMTKKEMAIDWHKEQLEDKVLTLADQIVNDGGLDELTLLNIKRSLDIYLELKGIK
jgi:hypothetical protein